MLRRLSLASGLAYLAVGLNLPGVYVERQPAPPPRPQMHKASRLKRKRTMSAAAQGRAATRRRNIRKHPRSACQ